MNNISQYIVLVGAITGLVGTIAGSVIAFLTLRNSTKKDRIKIRIKLQKSMLAWPQPGTTKPKIQDNMFTYNIANIGYKEFTVVSLGLELGRRSGGLFINDPIGTVKTPYKLQAGETCAFWGNYSDIRKKINKPRLRRKLKVRAYTSDYLGNTFHSNWFTITFHDRWYDKILVRFKSAFQDLLKLFWP